MSILKEAISALRSAFSNQAINAIQQLRTIYTETDPATGIVTLEAWRKDGKLDRTDGPATICRDPTTGTVTVGAWRKDGEKFEPSAEVSAAWLEKSGEKLGELTDFGKEDEQLQRFIKRAPKPG